MLLFHGLIPVQLVVTQYNSGGLVKSYMARPLEVERKWYVIDAEGRTLGRLASEIAKVLRGKNKPQYTPHVDVGDFVVVVNAEKVVVTGKKAEQKVYRRHSGYPGGLKTTTYGRMMGRRPEEILRKAVYGMMPKTRLARQQMRKLKIYAGPEHPHAAQNPQRLEVK
jgi:large subunit ribosomal protein L13